MIMILKYYEIISPNEIISIQMKYIKIIDQCIDMRKSRLFFQLVVFPPFKCLLEYTQISSTNFVKIIFITHEFPSSFLMIAVALSERNSPCCLCFLAVIRKRSYGIERRFSSKRTTTRALPVR